MVKKIKGVGHFLQHGSNNHFPVFNNIEATNYKTFSYDNIIKFEFKKAGDSIIISKILVKC